MINNTSIDKFIPENQGDFISFCNFDVNHQNNVLPFWKSRNLVIMKGRNFSKFDMTDLLNRPEMAFFLALSPDMPEKKSVAVGRAE